MVNGNFSLDQLSGNEKFRNGEFEISWVNEAIKTGYLHINNFKFEGVVYKTMRRSTSVCKTTPQFIVVRNSSTTKLIKVEGVLYKIWVSFYKKREDFIGRSIKTIKDYQMYNDRCNIRTSYVHNCISSQWLKTNQSNLELFNQIDNSSFKLIKILKQW